MIFQPFSIAGEAEGFERQIDNRLDPIYVAT